MKRIAIALIFLGIFIAIGFGFYYGVNEFATTSSTSKYIEVPVFGYMRCEEADFTKKVPTDSYKSFSDAFIVCQSTGDSLVQGCNVKFDLPASKDVSGAYSGLCVVQKDKDDLSPPEDCKMYWVRRNFLQGEYSDQLVTINLGKDEYLLAQYQEGSIFSALAFWNSLPLKERGLYQIEFRPFYIYRYDVFSLANGDPITDPDTQDCTFSGTLTNTNDIIESISGGELDDQYGTYAIGPDSLRDVGRKVAYISKFVPISTAQFEFLNDNEYCQDKRVYQVTEIVTTRGTYYVADVGVNKQLRTVECCNDADAVVYNGPDYYCDDNLEVQKYSSTEITCGAFNPCPMTGYVPGVDGKLYFQECIEGQCVTDSITPKCISNVDCPGDAVCNYNSLDPSKNECKSQDIIDQCGYNGCQASLGETIITCPQDCDPGHEPGIPNWVVYSLLGAGVLAIFAALASKKKGGAISL